MFFFPRIYFLWFMHNTGNTIQLIKKHGCPIFIIFVFVHFIYNIVAINLGQSLFLFTIFAKVTRFVLSGCLLRWGNIFALRGALLEASTFTLL